jgi:hypothetical protein
LETRLFDSVCSAAAAGDGGNALGCCGPEQAAWKVHTVDRLFADTFCLYSVCYAAAAGDGGNALGCCGHTQPAGKVRIVCYITIV